jgi:alpha-ketoglutarate-dependent 2,4-dichlorophenoxyacetate dioxygenase
MIDISLSVRQLHPAFVGEFSGVDAGRPVASAVVSALSDAIDQHAVLIFRGQDLDDQVG